MNMRSKLLRLRVRNIGCIGDSGLEVALDSIVCLVGKNNAGKSTILRAYELAQGESKFNSLVDRCFWAPKNEPSEIELDIHIPKGIGNISEDWKIIEGENLIIRSRWRWSPDSDKAERATWDPAKNDWSSTEKAGGADNVFIKSRLPKPLRIGSLQDADKTEGVLLPLALDPFIQQVTDKQAEPDSALAKAVTEMVKLVETMGVEHQKRFGDIAQRVQTAFSGVFPGIDLKLNVSMSTPTIKIADLLRSGSGIRIKDGRSETSLLQQGTGARRALFWSMLRVHNELKRNEEQRESYRKLLNAQIQKSKEREKEELNAKLAALEDGGPIPQADDDSALPGYLLLIDEPENALHPMASRAVQKHLYELAEDADWQVMMTTHSPYCINPLADHTTIVRLERSKGDESPLFTKTNVSDTISFSVDEKEQLQALQQMDTSFSEVFFGSYPILVEGDTEDAAFIAAVVEENHELANHVTLVKARGKAILPALIKMFEHFKISFGILHDVDWPYTSRGKSGMWTMNATIYEALSKCTRAGLTVRHQCSIPDFERYLGAEESSRDKPLEAYRLVRKEHQLKEKMLQLVNELYRGAEFGSGLNEEQDREVYLASLISRLTSWAEENNSANDTRLSPPSI